MTYDFSGFRVGFSLSMGEEANFGEVAETVVGIATAKINSFVFGEGNYFWSG